MPRRPWTVIVAAALALTAGVGSRAQTPSHLTFIGVSLDAATRQADRRLTELLYEKAGIRFNSEDLEYGQVIRRVVDWRREEDHFVARMTPYAYVVAELLGASVEPLATYVSATTTRTTYRSYFVVSRAAFEKPPELPDLLRYLMSRKDRAKFIYQS